MPIHVICTGCHKRFNAPDRFAGKRGPCPHCKTIILVPLLEDQLVIHEPEDTQAKGGDGRSVLQPLRWEPEGFSRLQIALATAGILFVILIAILLRWTNEDPATFPRGLLAAGLVLLALPISIGGYLFLREEEMGTFSRRAMLIRTGICAIAYCLVWLIYAFLPGFMDMADSPVIHAAVGTICLLLAGIAPWAALEFDYTNGLLHCGFHVVVTVTLCFIMGIHQLLWITPA